MIGRHRRFWFGLAFCMPATLAASACGGGGASVRAPRVASRVVGPRSTITPVHAAGVYAATTGAVQKRLRGLPSRVYVPSTLTGRLDVIDAATYRVERRDRVGALPNHVTPGWDLRHLYVDNTASGGLSVIDPATGRVTGSIPGVTKVYNLYFTPDGRTAVVVVEPRDALEFRDPHSWRLRKRLRSPCAGINHLDFSASGRYLIASCEFSGDLVEIEVATARSRAILHVGGSPLDVRLTPDGRDVLVANQARGGVSIVDIATMRERRFVHTGLGAHGLALSRNASDFYVSNRLAGTVSVLDALTERVLDTWHVGGSPDMLQVSANGARLWIADRFGSTVTVVDTTTGHVIQRIRVDKGPHGLALFPQPGRFSTGHNGDYR